MPNKLNLKVNAIRDDIVHCTLLINGKNCGKLTFDRGIYKVFRDALYLGCKYAPGHLINLSDDNIFVEIEEHKL